MIEIEHLRVVDFYAWLGCQATAASQLGCNQSTVSRRARQVGPLAKLRSASQQATFLALERQVHQCWRFSKGRDLRLHAYSWTNHLLQHELPESWWINPAAVSVTPACPLQLLQESVIDALLAPWPVVEGLDRDHFTILPVYFTPLVLLASAGSTLARDAGLSGSDIASLSQLGQLDFVPPPASQCSRHLDAQLFGDTPSQALALPAPEPRPAGCDASGRALPGEAAVQGDHVSIQEPLLAKRYWGTPLTPLIRPDLAVVSFATPVRYGECLVCLRDWAEHAEIQQLLEVVRRVLAVQGRSRPGLESLAVA